MAQSLITHRSGSTATATRVAQIQMGEGLPSCVKFYPWILTNKTRCHVLACESSSVELTLGKHQESTCPVTCVHPPQQISTDKNFILRYSVHPAVTYAASTSPESESKPRKSSYIYSAVIVLAVVESLEAALPSTARSRNASQPTNPCVNLLWCKICAAADVMLKHLYLGIEPSCHSCAPWPASLLMHSLR